LAGARGCAEAALMMPLFARSTHGCGPVSRSAFSAARRWAWACWGDHPPVASAHPAPPVRGYRVAAGSGAPEAPRVARVAAGAARVAWVWARLAHGRTPWRRSHRGNGGGRVTRGRESSGTPVLMALKVDPGHGKGCARFAARN